MDNRAHGHYTLVGSLTWGSVLNPLVAFTSTTVFISLKTKKNLYYFWDGNCSHSLQWRNRFSAICTCVPTKVEKVPSRLAIIKQFCRKNMWRKNNFDFVCLLTCLQLNSCTTREPAEHFCPLKIKMKNWKFDFYYYQRTSGPGRHLGLLTIRLCWGGRIGRVSCRLLSTVSMCLHKHSASIELNLISF